MKEAKQPLKMINKKILKNGQTLATFMICEQNYLSAYYTSQKLT